MNDHLEHAKCALEPHKLQLQQLWLNEGDFMNKWIEALESGEYRQGGGSLIEEYYDSLAYCCLGVAAVVANPNAEDLVDQIVDESFVKSKTDINYPYALKGDQGLPSELASINDREVPFEIIAKAIKHFKP